MDRGNISIWHSEPAHKPAERDHPHITCTTLLIVQGAVPSRPVLLGIRLRKLEFVVYIRRIFVALRSTQARGCHLRGQGRVVLGHAPALVPAHCVSAKVRIGRVQGSLYLLGLFRRRLLSG